MGYRWVDAHEYKKFVIVHVYEHCVSVPFGCDQGTKAKLLQPTNPGENTKDTSVHCMIPNIEERQYLPAPTCTSLQPRLNKSREGIRSIIVTLTRHGYPNFKILCNRSEYPGACILERKFS